MSTEVTQRLPGSPGATRPRRRRWPWLAVVVLALAVGGVALYSWMTAPPAPPQTSAPTEAPSEPAPETTPGDEGPVVAITAPTDGTDATEAILEQVAAVPDGSTVLFEAGARYRIDDTLHFEDRSDLTFDGNGAVFYTNVAGDARRQHWRFDGGSNITVRNLTLRGAHREAGVDGSWSSDYEHQAGFHVRDVDGFTLYDVRVRRVYGDGLFLGAAQPSPSYATWTRNVHVYDYSFNHIGRQGIAVIAARDVLIENGYIGDTHLNVLDLEPNKSGDGYHHVTFRNNTIGPAGTKFATIGGHEGTSRMHDVYIHDNTLVGTPMRTAIWWNRTAPKYNVYIEDNVSQVPSRQEDPNNPNKYDWVFRCRHADNVVIRGNVQPLAQGMTLWSSQG
nr:hypothetical protein [Actinomycetota bacterium]